MQETVRRRVDSNDNRNGAELCFAIIAVTRRESVIAQTALTGSLLSGCLMIFGTSLLFGGLQNESQFYPVTIARANAQMLVVSLVSIALPTAFKSWSQGKLIGRKSIGTVGSLITDGESGLLAVSHGAAIVLLLEFGSYLGFFYYTHCDIAANGPVLGQGVLGIRPTLVASGLLPALVSYPGLGNEYHSLKEMRDAAREARPDKPRYPIYFNTLVLTVSLTAMVFVSIYIVEAIEAPSKIMNVSKSFVGLVVMPTIIASVEHITAILRSRKENIAWIIEIAFGSSIRIALFVFPMAVIIGWVLGVPDMNMILDGFQVTILCLTIILVNHIMHNGIFHW
jgi:Ca2+:H+ antiporter